MISFALQFLRSPKKFNVHLGQKDALFGLDTQITIIFMFMTRERILCSIKCQNIRINMQSNPLKYVLESLKYAQYALLIQNMQGYRIT
jgi:hypothetical protein